MNVAVDDIKIINLEHVFTTFFWWTASLELKFKKNLFSILKAFKNFSTQVFSTFEQFCIKLWHSSKIICTQTFYHTQVDQHKLWQPKINFKLIRPSKKIVCLSNFIICRLFRFSSVELYHPAQFFHHWNNSVFNFISAQMKILVQRSKTSIFRTFSFKLEARLSQAANFWYFRSNDGNRLFPYMAGNTTHLTLSAFCNLVVHSTSRPRRLSSLLRLDQFPETITGVVIAPQTSWLKRRLIKLMSTHTTRHVSSD